MNWVQISTFRKDLSSIIFLLSISVCMFCQDQQLADSLETIYVNGDFKEENKLALLKELSINHHDPEQKLFYCNELLSIAKAMDSSQYFFTAYLEIGNTLADTGDLSLAIENYLSAGNRAVKENNNKGLAMIYASIGSIYIDLRNTKTGVSYYKKAIDILKNPEILKKKKDTVQLASSFNNLGYLYITINKPDSALIYLNKSEVLFEQIKHEIGMAYVTGNKGLAYAQLKDYSKAENNINNAFTILEKDGHFSGMCEFLMEISDIYFIRNEFNRASEFAHRGLDLAQVHNLKSEISAANLQLSKIYEKLETDNQSLDFYKNHILYRDSVTNLSSFHEIANMRTDFEVSLKQTEVDLLNEQKANQRLLILTLVVILGMTGLYYWNINKEKRKSDDLLLNILPSKTAEELKKNGMVKAKKFESVTVMFTDFQAFTRYSQKLSPEVLVKTVDYYFSKFDDIIEEHSLEKIKTIGDAYMCAGGLNSESPDHHLKIVKAAFKISEFVKESKHSELGELAHFDIRIGINTGPVVAGVVGKKKFAYDIWGDSVNVASRMESNSEAGRINISENTYQLIKNKFNCEYRGEIEVKNKGLMKMYFVEGKKAISDFNDPPKFDKFKTIKKTKATV
jgi:adenylate cyclase